MRASHRAFVTRIHANRAIQGGVTLCSIKPLEALRAPVSDQKICDMRMPSLPRERLRLKRRLIESPRKQAHPVQRNRRDDRVRVSIGFALRASHLPAGRAITRQSSQ